MNIDWKAFLLAQAAQIDADGGVAFPGNAVASEQAIYPLTQFSVLTASGKDAAKFLQGQCTCDINAVTASQGGMGAFCNAKGRAVATFLIAKTDDAFLIVLPAALADVVKIQLQRYILRAAVAISESGDAYSLIGIAGAPAALNGYPLPPQVYGVARTAGDVIIRLPVSPPRYLLLSNAASARTHWEMLRCRGFEAADTAVWRGLDIAAGIPWLDPNNSGQFIPQMLNLDRLGGIGFSKGCYTGQEVVARTQYLGSVKRRMYYAECPPEVNIDNAADIVDADAGAETVVGRLLAAHRGARKWQLLAVLQTTAAESKNLRLQNREQDKINAAPLFYVTEAAA